MCISVLGLVAATQGATRVNFEATRHGHNCSSFVTVAVLAAVVADNDCAGDDTLRSGRSYVNVRDVSEVYHVFT